MKEFYRAIDLKIPLKKFNMGCNILKNLKYLKFLG